MALNKAGLITSLTTLFSDPPTTLVDCADDWGDAVQSYASSIVPASTTVTAASTTLKTTLATTFQNNDSPSMLTTLEANFLTWATTIGGGMAGFTPTPPPGSIGFSSLSDASSHSIGATNFANKIDTWMKTGTAYTLPSGPLVNWS